MLKNHHDTNFLLSGFQSGFYLGFNGTVTNIRSKNSISASKNIDKVMEKVTSELDLGRIAGPFDSPPFDPFICTPLALREKSSKGKYRLLHNLSYPYDHTAVNLNIPDSAASVSYESLDRAFELLLPRPSCYLSKSDIADAFRLIPLHPSQYPLTGFNVKGKYYYDKALPMGARSACQIFETFSSALQDVLTSRYNVSLSVKVLDDFLFIGDSRTECLYALESFKSLCAHIGVPIAEHKTLPPTTKLTFLGIEIDTVKQEASIPIDKLRNYSASITQLKSSRHCSLRDLKSLIGKLIFVCKIIPAGRCFIRRLHNLTIGQTNPNSVISLPHWVADDLGLWEKFLATFNGRAFYCFRWTGDSCDTHFYTDSSKSGYGGTFGSHFIQGSFPQSWQDYNIAFLELFPIYLLVHIFAPTLSNSSLVLHSDNLAIVHILNTHTSKDEKIMSLLRPLILLLMNNNIIFKARHIRGLDNSLCDALSRSQVTPDFLRTHGLDPAPTPVPSSLRPTNWKP